MKSLLLIILTVFVIPILANAQPKHGRFYQACSLAAAQTDSELADIEAKLTIIDIQPLLINFCNIAETDSVLIEEIIRWNNKWYQRLWRRIH
jgi:hypothetical protein